MKADDIIRAKCFHPAGTFVEFRKEEIEQSIPERFEKMVRMYPNRLAVKTRSHALTYDELNKTANRVAHTVLAKCGNKNQSIALLMEHDAPVISAILGALKAGKFYVPLDPSLPHARSKFILEDVQANYIVTNTRNLPLAKSLV